MLTVLHRICNLLQHWVQNYPGDFALTDEHDDSSPIIAPSTIAQLGAGPDPQFSMPAMITGSMDKTVFQRKLKDLARSSKIIALVDAAHIAEEITRIQIIYFLAIQVSNKLLLGNPVLNVTLK